MLGTYSGHDPAGFLSERVVKQLALISRLDLLPAQTALLLRRSVQQNLHHLLRTIQLLNGDEGIWQFAMVQQWKQAVLKLRGESTAQQPCDRTLIHLPVRNGGHVNSSHYDPAEHALAASIESSKQQLSTF